MFLLIFLINNWTGGIWVFVGGAIVWLYNSVRSSADKAKRSADDAHVKIEKLPCDKYHDKINGIDVVNAKLDGVLQAIQLLSQVGSGKNKVIQSNSPITLTDFGRNLAEELSMMKYINKNRGSISGYIEENSKSLNPYDIQQLCFNYVLTNPEDVLTHEGYEKVKYKAFDIGEPVISLMQAASILIRDRYFKEKDMTVGDIDAHDPMINNK